MDRKDMKEVIINTIIQQLEVFVEDIQGNRNVIIELETLLNDASPKPKMKQKFNFTYYLDNSNMNKKNIIQHFIDLSGNILGYDALFSWLYNNGYM